MSAFPKKPFIDLREIHEISSLVSSIIGLFLNFLLIYLILQKSGSKLKTYRKILLHNCIIDIIYNIAVGITRTQTDFKNGNIFVITTSAYGDLSFIVTNIFTTTWIAAIILCVASLPVQFIYRYFLIVKKLHLSIKQYTVLVSVATVIPLLFSILLYWFMLPTQEIIDEMSKSIYSSIFYYKKDLNFVAKNILSWKLMILVFCVSTVVSGSYRIVLWTSFKVWKHLKVMEVHMSSQTRYAHHQMTKAMIAQAIIPFIFNLLPIFINIIFVILYINVDGVGLVVSLIFCWIPVTNSLTTIIVIKQYRNFVIGIIKNILRIKTVSSPVALSEPVISTKSALNIVNLKIINFLEKK